MPSTEILAAAVIAALALDHFYGEPPLRWHPVVWMGCYLDWAGRRIAPVETTEPDWRRFILGLLAWIVGALLVLALTLGAQGLLAQAPFWIAVLATGALLKPLLAWRMLRAEVDAVEAALAVSLEAGRERLAWLVSREVHTLSAQEVRESAMESLAENLNDSVVAPLFWFALAGLPGAALYRFANTVDAMWGYRGRWEWAGKAAARIDDALSWIPARITALALALAAGGLPWAALRREAARTPSPNGGWPMAAMALALDRCLGKPGVYVLHARAEAPQPGDIDRAGQLAARALAVAAMGLVVLLIGAQHA